MFLNALRNENIHFFLTKQAKLSVRLQKFVFSCECVINKIVTKEKIQIVPRYKQKSNLNIDIEKENHELKIECKQVHSATCKYWQKVGRAPKIAISLHHKN